MCALHAAAAAVQLCSQNLNGISNIGVGQIDLELNLMKLHVSWHGNTLLDAACLLLLLTNTHTQTHKNSEGKAKYNRKESHLMYTTERAF